MRALEEQLPSPGAQAAGNGARLGWAGLRRAIVLLREKKHHWRVSNFLEPRGPHLSNGDDMGR